MTKLAKLREGLQKWSGLRERIALTIGLFVFGAGLVVTLVNEHHLSRVLQASARAHLQDVATHVSQSITHDVRSRRLELARLAAVLGSADTIHSGVAQQVLDELLRGHQSAYAWIGLTNDKGIVLAATQGLLDGVDVSSRPWFASGRGGDYFGDVHEAKLLANYVGTGSTAEPPRFFDVASPVRNVKGLWEGVLGAHLYIQWIHRVVDEAMANRTNALGLDVFVADGRGDWLMRPRTAAGANLNELLDTAAGDAYLLAKQQASLDGLDEGVTWTVVVRERVEDAYAPVYQNRRDMLMATPLVALLLAGATWFVAGRTVRPVVRLADSARRVASTTGHALDEDLTGNRDVATLLDQTLSRLALTDPLTGLANRNALKQHLLEVQQLQVLGGYPPVPYAVLLLNLDDFHLINNTRGHDVGDQLLRAVGQRLQQLQQPEAYLSRLGGDEFVMVLSSRLHATVSISERYALAYANRVIEAFHAPFETTSGTCRCLVSLGLCLVGTPSTSPDDALTNAEVAMQEAKRLGKNQVSVFDHKLQARLVEQVRFEQDLDAAIPAQLVVYFQPQVNRDRQIIGAELLIRWNHPERGFVSPAQFIPIAEQTGRIVKIDHWVLEQACRQLRVWQDTTHQRDWTLAVNVSALEFARPDYVDQVRRLLDLTGANPRRLKLELTESTLAMDVEAVVTKMGALRDLGITIALDDFGTGFSSLSYLKRMPIQQLKIDQSFVRDLLTSESSLSIVRTVVALGAGMGLDVIAEGVETEAQCQRLAELGCVSYQGYLFGRPMTIAELEALA